MAWPFGHTGERRSMDWWGTDTPRDSRTITPESATYLGPVFSAIRHVVDYLSTLPVDQYRLGDKGSRVEVGLSSLFRSQNMPGRPGLGQWFGQIAYGLVTVGNTVGWIVETDGFGYPTVIAWLNRHDWNFDESRKQWYVYGQPVPASQIVHIPWIVPTGCTLGMSPIEHYASIVRAGISAQDYADVKRGGGIPPAHLKNTQLELTPQQSAAAASRASAAFASGRPFVTGSDWDLTLTSIPPNHAQFIETLKLSANTIASIYGIDPREVGGQTGDSLTYATDESRSLNRANNLRPYIVRIEQAVSRLLPEKQFVKLNVDSTIRTDIKTRFDIYATEIEIGTRSVNEVRALEDRPPVKGGDVFNLAPKTAAPTQQRTAAEGEPQ